jgi:NTE family protein
VLSAGGMLGDPWHSGVLAHLESATGWDTRRAELVVGTSAGSVTATILRTGISAIDRVAHFRGEPISEAAAALYSRITTEYTEPRVDRDWRPLSPKMSITAMWPPWKPDPLRVALGGVPRGTKSGEPLEKRRNELHPERWPVAPTWVIAVRADDGRRVVFGRDDVKGNIGQAVRASSAVPGAYVPVKIGTREYIDGGVHSSTNADLTSMLGFDLVIISSVMTATPGTRNWLTDPTRSWFSRKLADEVDEIRRRGTPVIVFEPDTDALRDLSKHNEDPRARAVAAGAATVERVLNSTDGAGLRDLIARAV